MSDALRLLGFLSIFHILGGIAIGVALRRLLVGNGSNFIFFLLWGGVFGGLPFVIGINEFLQEGMVYFVIVQLIVFCGAILITVFFPAWMFESINSPSNVAIAFGGLFMLIGFGVAASMVGQDTFNALIIACLFGGSGAFMFIRGLVSLFKGKE